MDHPRVSWDSRDCMDGGDYASFPPSFPLGGNDEDPSRYQVGNSSHESSHSVRGKTSTCLELIDKVDKNTDDSIESSHGEPVCSAINSSIPDEKVSKEDNDDLAMKYLNTCAVKAKWSTDIVKFDFRYTGTPSLEMLKELVASNLEGITPLEPGRFNLKYKDNSDKNKDWITMANDSHLADALSTAEIPKAPKNKILTLKVSY